MRHFSTEDLDKIAGGVIDSGHGHFLKNFSKAWISADTENKTILRDAWEKLIEKYRLDQEFL